MFMWLFHRLVDLVDSILHWREKKEEPVVVEPPIDPLDDPEHPANQAGGG